MLKVVEWHGDVTAGFTLNSNTFFTLYYMYTGIHLMHVLVGIVVLWVMRAHIATDRVTPTVEAAAEGGAVYWHMVDLLWIALFALLFLVR